MTDQRVCFQIIIGVDQNFKHFDRAEAAFKKLDENLTRLVGGITRINGFGTWTPGAEGNDFDGEIECDHSAIYNIIVTPDVADEFYERLKKEVSAIAQEYELPVEHIQVVAFQGKAMHFCISDNV